MRTNSDNKRDSDSVAGANSDSQPTEEERALEAQPTPKDLDERLAEDFLSDLPKPMRERVMLFMGQMVRSGAMSSPLLDKIADKIEAEHVGHMLDSIDEKTRLEHDDKLRSRVFNLVLCSIAVGVLVFLVLQLGASNPDLLEKLVVGGVSLVGGFGGGLGWKSWKESQS